MKFKSIPDENARLCIMMLPLSHRLWQYKNAHMTSAAQIQNKDPPLNVNLRAVVASSIFAAMVVVSQSYCVLLSLILSTEHVLYLLIL